MGRTVGELRQTMGNGEFVRQYMYDARAVQNAELARAQPRRR